MYPSQHTMELVQTHGSGAEEWFCPTCGRRFLMTWSPAYKKLVLDAGDEYAVHSGGKGGITLQTLDMNGQPPPSSAADSTAELSDEMRRWLEEAGFDKLWGDTACE